MNQHAKRIHLALLLGALGALQGCNPLAALQAGVDLVTQGRRVGRIGAAAGAQFCHVSGRLMDRRAKETLRRYHAGQLPAEQAPRCRQGPAAANPVVYELVGDRVRCPVHGAPGEVPDPLEAVREDIEQDPLAFDPEEWATWLWAACLLAVGGAGFWYLRGGADADLAAALERNPPGPIGGSPGYRCVEGRVACAQPLLAPRARVEVAAYRYLQSEEWEERNRHGAWTERRTVHKDETELAAFDLVGDAGRVEVAPGGARLEPRLLHEEEVPAGGGDSRAAASAGLELPAPGATAGLGTAGQRRRHRYVHKVYGLALDDRVLVLGHVSDDDPPRVQRNPDADAEDEPYLVASGTHAENVRRFREDGQVGYLLVLACLGLALILGFLAWALPRMV